LKYKRIPYIVLLFGKEYWFMKFTADDGSRRQFFLTFGRSAGDIEVNGKYMENSRIIDNKTEGYCVSWAYDEVQRDIADDLGIIEVKNDRVTCSSKETKVEFYGSFPKYVLDTFKRTAKKFAASDSKRDLRTAIITQRYPNSSEAYSGIGLQNWILISRVYCLKKVFQGNAMLRK